MLSFYFYLLVGITLIALELATATFYLLIIGISCVIASFSALILHNWMIPTIAAGVLSIIGCFFISRYKPKSAAKGGMLVKHIGQRVEVVETNNNRIRVLYSGTYWDAKTQNPEPIKIGDHLIITKFSNHELEIAKEIK
ncbi:MAG TPA: NfeD family protein [Burkholderiales bacterium]|nr:NfeD family protein [Burkholderiales bacterium]